MDGTRMASRVRISCSRMAGFWSAAAAMVLFCFFVVKPACGQQPTDGNANLEQRVRDLESLVNQLQARQQQSNSPSQPMAAPTALQSTTDGSTSTPGPITEGAASSRSNATNVHADSTWFDGQGSELLQTQGEESRRFEQSMARGAAIPGPFAGWRNNGFFITSGDDSFIFRVTGQLQLDYREFLDTDDRTDADTFLLRRARFGLEATLFKYYEFRFMPDFGQGQAVIQDGYLNVHYFDELQVELGKFKQPFSYEQLIQDRYVPTLERSIIDQLVPARDLGAMIHGQKLFGDRFEYAVALSNGEINGNTTDPNNHTDFNGRIAAYPLNDPNLPEWMRRFEIGLSGGFGIEQEVFTPATLRTPDTVPFLVFNSTVRADGLRSRISPELSYFYGPFGMYAQYYHQEQQMRPSASGPGFKFLTNVPFTGYAVLASLLLTGETRTSYSQAIEPLRPFDPRCPVQSPGAWEGVFRVSSLDVGDVVFSPGAAQLANPARNANEATEVTVGINWYLNRWVRMQVNYEHDMFNQPVLLGTTAQNDLKNQDSIFTRFQIIF